MQWAEKSPYLVRDSFEGLLCLGRSGSGKTSGPGRAVALSMLSAGYGGLVLVAKNSEEQWRKYCRQTHRSEDLIVVSPGGPWRFNPLAHALARPGSEHVETLVHLFSTILEIADNDSGKNSQQGSEAYWMMACKQLIRNFIGLLILATGTVKISDLYLAITTAPKSRAEFERRGWQKTSACFRWMALADGVKKTEIQQHDWRLIFQYISEELATLAPRTRSIITSMFTSLIDVMQRGVLYELFGRDTTVTPEDVERGKIIVVDVGVKEHGQVGTIANVLFKYCFMRSIERRDVRTSSRPVFLFADEAQYFTTSHDALFLTTCRSARISTIYLSQSVSNFYAALGGGDRGRAQADAIFTNLNCKIACCNGDNVTNEWFSNQIGHTRQFFFNGSQSHTGDDWFETVTGLGEQNQSSSGMGEQMSHDLPPQIFTTFRTGGRSNKGLIDSVVFQSGRIFPSTGRTWTHAVFKQTVS